MTETRPLAVLGGRPAFAVPVGMPRSSWDADKVATAFRGIFERRYFTNNGPLVCEFEEKIAGFLGVRHAICVGNGMLALTILLEAMQLSGEVIVPAIGPPVCLQATRWAGLTPVRCDVDEATGLLSEDTLRPLLTQRSTAILGVHVFGNAGDPAALGSFAERQGLTQLFEASNGIAGSHTGRPRGGFGAGEAFSFGAGSVLEAAGGGCITTDDDALAGRSQTIRTFQPGQTIATVARRINGKMSEAQAALGLISLADLSARIDAAKARRKAYARGLHNVPGLRLVGRGAAGESDFHDAVIEIDAVAAGLDRDCLWTALAAENVVCANPFDPGSRRPASTDGKACAEPGDFPATERLRRRLLQLPNRPGVSLADVDTICSLLCDIYAQADAVRSHLRPLST